MKRGRCSSSRLDVKLSTRAGCVPFIFLFIFDMVCSVYCFVPKAAVPKYCLPEFWLRFCSPTELLASVVHVLNILYKLDY
jgi:hypothetical protein